MKGLSIDELKIGDIGWIEKTISEHDVYTFAGLTGDFSWVHVNEERAKKGRFGQRIAHGMLTIGFISCVIGTQIPGPGTIYLTQDMKFLKPVFFGDTIHAEVEVIEIIKEKNKVKLKTSVSNQQGDLVLTGEAYVIPPQSE
ncbi:MAG: MaoC family dehydratase [Acidobacteriota bacterium]